MGFRKCSLVGAVMAAALVGCGSDEGGDEAYADFCEAELEVEAAVASEDPEAVAPAFENLVAAAPDAAAEVVEQTVTEARKFLESGGEPTPEFNAAYGEMMETVKDECGFNAIDAKAEDFEFSGIDDEVDAGPTVITFENNGAEYHELALARINDDVDLTAEELLALPQEEAEGMVTFLNGAFAAPGETGYTAVDLEEGRYLAACFVPVGTTPEAVEADPEFEGGEPHFMQGMFTEFTVG
jgi:hypothetical protein